MQGLTRPGQKWSIRVLVNDFTVRLLHPSDMAEIAISLNCIAAIRRTEDPAGPGKRNACWEMDLHHQPKIYVRLAPKERMQELDSEFVAKTQPVRDLVTALQRLQSLQCGFTRYQIATGLHPAGGELKLYNALIGISDRLREVVNRACHQI